MKQLTLLIPAPIDEPLSFVSLDANTGHYGDAPEDALLPPEGEDVWIDHPAFKRCALLREALAAVGNDWFMETMSGRDYDYLNPTADWLNGRTPIPDDEVAELLETREWLAECDGTPVSSLPPIRVAA